MNSHDQESVTCHDFDHAANNSLSVTSKRPSGRKHGLSASGKQELLKFHSSIRNLLSLAGEKRKGGKAACKSFRISSFVLYRARE